MRVEVFNVKHGACAMITGTNGKRVMIDCGFREGNDVWRPSSAFAGQRIESLVLQNLDEDHVDDLPNVWRDLRISALYSNPSVTSTALLSMKTAGMDAGVAKAYEILKELGPGRSGPIADLGEIKIWAHSLNFGEHFTDTNNLSVVLIVEYGTFLMVFGGDLEKSGWETLLKCPVFRERVGPCKVLVGSHHGRESGKCDELFQICNPEIVIFSDDARRYSTQETDAWYRQRVTGIPDLTKSRRPGEPQPNRHVFTTRRDGTITIEVDEDGRYVVTAGSDSDTSDILDFEEFIKSLSRRIA